MNHKIIFFSTLVLIGLLAIGVTFAGKGGNKGKLTECNDGIDNDGDGLIDYPADPGCLSLSDTSELNPTTSPPPVQPFF